MEDPQKYERTTRLLRLAFDSLTLALVVIALTLPFTLRSLGLYH